VDCQQGVGDKVFKPYQQLVFGKPLQVVVVEVGPQYITSSGKTLSTEKSVTFGKERFHLQYEDFDAAS